MKSIRTDLPLLKWFFHSWSYQEAALIAYWWLKVAASYVSYSAIMAISSAKVAVDIIELEGQ